MYVKDSSDRDWPVAKADLQVQVIFVILYYTL